VYASTSERTFDVKVKTRLEKDLSLIAFHCAEMQLPPPLEARKLPPSCLVPVGSAFALL
jgi:hypothetical protein